MLSKSSFLTGSRCSKLLWKKLNEPEAFPKIDPTSLSNFEQGHRIGKLAKQLYPGGIEVTERMGQRATMVGATKDLLEKRVPLFEAAFAYDGGYAQVDILVPDGEEAWRIIEVKSGTDVKDEHVLDVAFQLHVCRGAGLKITGCAILHVDSDYVREGEVDPAQLFREEDVTTQAADLVPEISDKIWELEHIVAAPFAPLVSLGPYCNNPHPCELKGQCWKYLPKYPVTDLANDTGGKRWRLLDEGITALTDIPDPESYSPKHQIQIKTARTGEAHLSPAVLNSFLRDLEYPLAYFDIETASAAIPLYDGTSPYQQIPFQFSLHVQNTPGGPLSHHEFLAKGKDDPRPAFLAALKKALPEKGSIIAYNAVFEKRVLKEADIACGDGTLSCEGLCEEGWVDPLAIRFLDLLIPFRSFAFHHRDQHGSASIKSVLPVLSNTSYKDLAIQDGNAAAQAFVATEFGEMPAAEREQTRHDLLEYCKLDTMAMVEVLEALRSKEPAGA